MSNLTDISYVKKSSQNTASLFQRLSVENFLINPSVCPKMAQMCGAGKDVGVIEIGPGAGVLTNELAEVSYKVVAVELDKRLLPVLDETLSHHDNIKIINGDAMKLDFHELIKEEFGDGHVVICANLPYWHNLSCYNAYT